MEQWQKRAYLSYDEWIKWLGTNETMHFKNVNNFLNTNIYSYLETPVVNVIKLFTVVSYDFS